MVHLGQLLLLLGHGGENPTDGIHGGEKYLFVVESPATLLDELADWTIKVSDNGGFPDWMARPVKPSNRYHGSLRAPVECVLDELLTESA